MGHTSRQALQSPQPGRSLSSGGQPLGDEHRGEAQRRARLGRDHQAALPSPAHLCRLGEDAVRDAVREVVVDVLHLIHPAFERRAIGHTAKPLGQLAG
jgi:hypothetical protein